MERERWPTLPAPASIRAPEPPSLPEVLAPGEVDKGELRECSIGRHDLAAGVRIARIDGCILTGCVLRGMDWRGVHICDSRLVACDLANAKLSAAVLTRVEMIDCRMTGIDLSDAILKDVSLLRCRGDLAIMFGTAAARTRFEGCDLRQNEFEGVSFEEVGFRGCDLSESRFVKPRLNGVDLRGSMLRGVQMPPDALRGAIIDIGQAPFVAELLGVQILEG